MFAFRYADAISIDRNALGIGRDDVVGMGRLILSGPRCARLAAVFSATEA